MRLPAVQVYVLQFASGAKYQVTLRGAKRNGFGKPATLVCPKLYVVARGRTIHYVGVTNRPMSARINLGLKARGVGGYHGYKCKKIRAPLRLFVWAFRECSGKEFLRQLETVEAEFAFHVRMDSGHWPRSQTEIHFYDANPGHLAAVSAMQRVCAA